MARCLSRSRSFALESSSTSLPSSTKNPPLELTIFDRSYSKYFPSRESRFNGFGAVGEVDTAETTSRGRFWLAFGVDEELASCSRCLCLAFAIVEQYISGIHDGSAGAFLLAHVPFRRFNSMRLISAGVRSDFSVVGGGGVVFRLSVIPRVLLADAI